jgi:hypothetical protein
VVSAADSLRSLISDFRPEPLLFFQVAPRLSSQELNGPCYRFTVTQKICKRRESNPGLLD